MSSALSSLPQRLESLVGASRVIADPAACAEYAVDEMSPSVVVKPSSAQEIGEIVRLAAHEKLAIIPCGNRTKLSIGMPPSRYDIAIDMTGIKQIAHYDPGDLTLSVDAGANFNDFAVLLYNQKQFLPLATPFYFDSTIGGIIASGVDSGLRQYYGTARDFLIGAEFVDGTGKLCKSGGRVVKNVTGYDLHKLLIGSLGTLAVITRLNFRTFPAAPASRGFVGSFLTVQDALELLHGINDLPLSLASVELISPQLLQVFLEAEKIAAEPPAAPLEGRYPADCWHLCVSVEGSIEVCERSSWELTRLAERPSAQIVQRTILNENEGADFWHYLGQAVPLLLEASPYAAIFKIAELPSQLAPLSQQLSVIAEQANFKHAFLPRGCGVVYFALLPSMDAASAETPATPDAETLRGLSRAASSIYEFCTRQNASATLPWCPTALKRDVNVWGLRNARVPSSGTEHALMNCLKSAFDPHNILAPGRGAFA